MAWVTVMTVQAWTCGCGKEIIRSNPRLFRCAQDEHVQVCSRSSQMVVGQGWKATTPTYGPVLVTIRHAAWQHPDTQVRYLKTAAAPVFDGSRKH